MASSAQPQNFIFGRELAEVYLLLDNVSTSASKALPEPPPDDPLFGTKANGNKSKSWLEQVCEIGWPPDAGLNDRARKAAKLVRARDMLNQAAFPATGATIAFTLLVAGEDTLLRSRHDHGAEPAWWRRLLLWTAGYGHDAKAPTASFGVKWPWQGWKDEPPSRFSLATMAFPSLARSAKGFRWGIFALVVVLLVWLYATCRLSWDVATGNKLLDQFSAAQVAKSLIEGQIVEAQSPPVNAPAQQRAAGSAVDAQHFCSGGSPAKPIALDSNQLKLCLKQRQAIYDDRLAQINLTAWARQRDAFAFPITPIVGHYLEIDSTDGRTFNEQSVSAWLAILGGVILPIFYGVLGAGAAAIRNLSFKMRDSLLAPRDLTLSLVRLALGAVIGGCVGLFVAPTGAQPDNSGLLGTVHLSAAALCFVAGFGVDGVFQALDSLIRRVFNMGEASAK